MQILYNIVIKNLMWEIDLIANLSVVSRTYRLLFLLNFYLSAPVIHQPSEPNVVPKITVLNCRARSETADGDEILIEPFVDNVG